MIRAGIHRSKEEGGRNQAMFLKTAGRRAHRNATNCGLPRRVIEEYGIPRAPHDPQMEDYNCIVVYFCVAPSFLLCCWAQPRGYGQNGVLGWTNMWMSPRSRPVDDTASIRRLLPRERYSLVVPILDVVSALEGGRNCSEFRLVSPDVVSSSTRASVLPMER
ncbi:hypothetical protein TTRE_0000601801 [Trichuris trichiura]|uniref:Uncharacterized protein n=1 Tax=Trichuris trichiura TaxID=36087 RepID=A0A077ZD13_TRITR|nr:hypothetical protein TTRE_0000601801 [Trichuris trichiura]